MRISWVAALVTAVLAAGVAGVVQAQRDRDGAGLAASSYAFDVTDQTAVAARADALVIGQVIEERGRDGGGRRVLSVRVTESLWGDVAGDVTLRTTAAGEPRVGATYALAIGRSDDADGSYALFAGPHAATEVTAGNRERVEEEWRRARVETG